MSVLPPLQLLSLFFSHIYILYRSPAAIVTPAAIILPQLSPLFRFSVRDWVERIEA
jgi:hypothetical protein